MLYLVLYLGICILFRKDSCNVRDHMYGMFREEPCICHNAGDTDECFVFTFASRLHEIIASLIRWQLRKRENGTLTTVRLVTELSR